MIRIKDIKLPTGHNEEDVSNEIAKILCLDKIYPGNSYPKLSFEMIRRSIDARKKPQIFFVYTVRVLMSADDEQRVIKYLTTGQKNNRVKRSLEKIITSEEIQYVIPECGDLPLKLPPVIVGSGPAGMFAALSLARRGFCPIVIERGEDVDARSRTVKEFWDSGKLDTESNVQFGEGGAGTFSDGKLVTLTKDTNGRNTFVIKTFYEHGASKDITVDAKPHIGTDILKSVVRSIREEIISLGGKVIFNTRLTGITTEDGAKQKKLVSVKTTNVKTGEMSEIKTDVCVLCPGHSARDTFEMLYDMGVEMSAKSFATGFRVIHPQSLVNEWQYGVEDPKTIGLPAAEYKVTNETSKGRRVYSFCMCPGGYVVNASSEEGRLTVNGMSESKRDGKYANSAMIVAIDPDDFIQDKVEKGHPLAGMYYQRRIEEEAFLRAKGKIPVQTFEDFKDHKITKSVQGIEDGIKGEFMYADLRGLLSDDIDEAVIESMHKFGYTRKCFDSSAVMLGVEMRTSSPVRIGRDDGLMSNIKGLYPCGEGAGYAGGITSAAADGLKCAEKIIEKYHPEGKRD
ncbi:MAG: FAD-dependent oxidoreductase [Lachnospiraceae bacterium]|nr:FAD-dependent oxidoreductase [Lachnospiraceae bacterium]